MKTQLFIVFLCGLGSLTQPICGETVTETRYGYEGTSVTLRSHGFGEDYILDEETIYNQTVYSTDGSYLKINFSDFDLHEGSILKLFDGRPWDEDRVASYWLKGRPPIYYTKSDHVQLVWKPYGLKSEVDTSDTTSGNHVGYKAVITFVRTHRDFYGLRVMDSENIDVNGYCGEVTEDWGGVGAPKQWTPILPSQHHSYKTLNYTCIWSGVTDYEYLAIRTNLLTAPGFYYEVKKGLSSEDDLVYHVDEQTQTTDGGTGVETIRIYHLTRFRYYIRLNARMTREDFFAFAFARTPGTEAFGAARRLSQPSPDSSVCPQKSLCSDGVTCTFYWLPCDSWAGEPACDTPADSSISSQTCEDIGAERKCYISEVDKCDSFNDCYNEVDESDCTTSWLKMIWNILGPFLFFIVIMIGFGIIKGIFKGIGKVCDGLREFCDCCCDGCGTLKNKLENCCSDYRPCTSHTPPYSPSPRTSPTVVRRSSTTESVVVEQITRVDELDLSITDTESEGSTPRRPNVISCTPSAPPLAPADPTAPPSYLAVVSDPSSTPRPPASAPGAADGDLPTYDEALSRAGSERVIYPPPDQDTPNVPPPSYDSVV